MYNTAIFRLPETIDADLQQFQSMVGRFEAKAISEAEFRAFRVPMGVYEQRESGTYMLRVRVPAGGVLCSQLRQLAAVAQKYGSSTLHVTTRQDIQVHRVPLKNIPQALFSLREAGLSTKGGGGNTVRNITACYDSGVCPREVFDVAPYAVALTERLLADPLSFQLPRKYKIAFSACAEDCAGTAANDVGFVAKEKNGQFGFAAYAAGGMGAKSRVADLLHEFIPAGEAYLVAEAIKRVFDKNGDRKNKHLARLRFLVERIGFAAFRELYEKELAALRASAPPLLNPGREEPPGRPSESAGDSLLAGPRINSSTVGGSEISIGGSEISLTPNFSWVYGGDCSTETVFNSFSGRKSYARPYSESFQAHVAPQKQPGFFLVQIPLALGDIEASTLSALADAIEVHGGGFLYTTHTQNLALKWVRAGELPTVHEKLARLGLADPQPPVLRNMIACAGASTCRLGICLSRGLAKAIENGLRQSKLNLAQLGDLKIHISGCPNSCGRHALADIGFSGAARRVEGRLVPCYAVHLGGGLGEGRTRFGLHKGVIPAKNVPEYVQELLAAFLPSPETKDFHAFLQNCGRQIAEDLLAKYRQVPSFEEDKNYYYDWGAETIFSLAGRGPGECSAGVFDLIEVDLASAREALNAGKHYAAAALAARSLLITRGLQPKNDLESFELFQKHFVAEGLVERELASVILAGIQSAPTPNPESLFKAVPAQVSALVTAVRLLYENMDSSLRFKPVTAEKLAATAPAETAHAAHDFRGVTCPLNYVKTKMALGKLQKGQVLSILLDEQGATNVPDSAAKDGHEVLSVTRQDSHWQVLIRKGA